MYVFIAEAFIRSDLHGIKPVISTSRVAETPGDAVSERQRGGDDYRWSQRGWRWAIGFVRMKGQMDNRREIRSEEKHQRDFSLTAGETSEK